MLSLPRFTSLALATLTAVYTSFASAKVAEVEPNVATLELKDMVDADEGYLPDAGTREAVATKLAAPALTGKVLKCSPMRRRIAIAMIDSSGKRPRVMVAHPDRKLGTCLEKALAGVGEPGYTLTLTIKLMPPPDPSPDRAPVRTTP